MNIWKTLLNLIGGNKVEIEEEGSARRLRLSIAATLAAGVAAARNGTKSGWTPYNRPQMWIPSDSTRDYVARKIAEAEGVSMSTARREIVPFLAAMTHHCKNRELTVAMTAKYDLDAEHVSFVTGSGETTNKVEGIVEDAKERKEEDVVAHAGSAFEGAVRDSSAESDASASDSAEGSDGTDSTETADSSGSDASEDDDDAQSGLTDFA